MSEKPTLVVGMPSRLWNLPFESILEHHLKFSDAIVDTPGITSDDLPNFIANQSFVYAYNSYKALGRLLPELYHEAAATVLRQLWEVSLNLHWMMLDPDDRAEAFVNFTVVEARKLFKISDEFGSLGSLDDFDKSTHRFQSRFRKRSRQGKDQIQTNFTSESIRNRSEELGEPWGREYDFVYHLTSMHAHGAPGAVLHAVFLNHYGNVQARERDQTALIGTLAIQMMKRNVDLLADVGIIPDKSAVDDAYSAFQACITPQTEDKSRVPPPGK